MKYLNINAKEELKKFSSNYKLLFKKFEKNLKIFFLFILILEIIFIIGYAEKNKIKICLCCIGKNENLYAKEFVEHYKKIGYDKIFIYDNNEKKGEHFEEVINDYIKDGFVKIINYRERNLNIRPQFDAYKDCYEKNNKLYDWLSFFDMDEFLEINKKYKSIHDFLNDKIFRKCLNIKINWVFYMNNYNLYYENKSIEERMKKSRCSGSPNFHVKSTVRGNLYTNYWNIIANPHTSNLNVTSCSSSGKIIKFDSPFNIPPDLINAKLHHYHYKSFEEYCLKLKRGNADQPKYVNEKLIKQRYKSLYSQNKYNKTKLDIINRLFLPSHTENYFFIITLYLKF